jgi:hypothetical protein
VTAAAFGEGRRGEDAAVRPGWAVERRAVWRGGRVGQQPQAAEENVVAQLECPDALVERRPVLAWPGGEVGRFDGVRWGRDVLPRHRGEFVGHRRKGGR